MEAQLPYVLYKSPGCQLLESIFGFFFLLESYSYQYVSVLYAILLPSVILRYQYQPLQLSKDFKPFKKIVRGD
jgi:hypothetical protein